jgi:hypothetical protein
MNGPMAGLSAGVGKVGEWTARHWREKPGSDEAGVRSLAWELVQGFEALSSGPFPVGLHIELFGDDERDARTDDEFKAGLDALLETVRSALAMFSGASFGLFTRSVENVDDALALRLRLSATAALGRTRELEKALVFFGAGADEEADIAADLLPAPEWDAAGPSV